MDNHNLMIEGLIYLGSAALFVPIAVRLGLGSVLGYLIAGCIIGPWGLKLVSDAESILTFAEIGVVLMLFVIGLELDPKRLWTMRASVFGGGRGMDSHSSHSNPSYCLGLLKPFTWRSRTSRRISTCKWVISQNPRFVRGWSRSGFGGRDRRRWEMSDSSTVL